MEGRRTFAIRFKWTNSGEDRFSVQQSRLLKYFCFSLFFFLCIFFPPPDFQRYTNENAKHGAERRVSTIFNWPCTSMPIYFPFRSVRNCGLRASTFPPRPQFYRAPRNCRPALREKIHSPAS